MQGLRIVSYSLALMAGLAAHAHAYQAVDVVRGGTITGRITFKGTSPAPKTIAVTKDAEACGREKTVTSLVVGADQGIQNVVVRIADITRGRRLPAPAEVTFDQKGCEFVPHVLLFPAGSRVRIRNDDGILHNTTVNGEANPAFTVAQPEFRRVVEKRIAKAEMPIKVRCDVHSWMGAWWISQEHPYYALTDSHGAFTLTDVPPGTYTLEAWHETLGKTTAPVVVAADAVARVTVEMTNR